MDDRVLRLRVGVVVLAAAMITAFLVARFGDLHLLGTGTYTVYVRFPNAPGVTPGTPVRRSGVQIGRVRELLLETEPRGVRTELEIEDRYEVTNVDSVWIKSASVLGDAVIEVVAPQTVPPTAARIDDGTLITNGRVASNPLETITNIEPNLQSALVSVERAGNSFQQAAENFNAAIGNNQDQLPRVAQKAERALDQFGVAMTNLNTIFDDPQMRADLRKSLQDLPQTLNEFRTTLGKANDAFDSFKSTSDRASRNLENLENFTKPLGERGQQLVDNIDGSLANINELLEQLVVFADGLNSREGTLGRILHDDQLYLRLERTLTNFEDISAQVKPILADVRVFSDKIARDPRQLGLKGALDRRPLGAGGKSAPAPYEYDSPVHGDAWDPVIVP
jgi:phospholipid/cholesterol/gamma-HCH transport system substrate-binding protein